MDSRRVVLITVAALLLLSARFAAQRSAAAQAGAPGSARAAAPDDYTGYWVSEVTEKWRFRMLVPDKNDYIQVPLNPEGRRVAALWDPAKDEAGGEACRSYGAAALLQVPGRLHITWQDDNTLRLDTDSGTQTRLFRFGGSPPANEKPSWQGYSAATWGGDEPRDRRDGQGGPVQDKEGRLVVDKAQQRTADYLQVVTTRMRPGYLQKNGVPYSANAVVEEYFDVFSDPYTKNTWLGVTTMVNDPQYLIEPLIMHAHFKKLPDASGWDPTPCRANEPR
ncbi:MAG TPA: hypothetical protein VFU28_24710 [Vicinamibacterales bacterium]|nr:hypothetical protein [Vicinamibacterales bacterium]